MIVPLPFQASNCTRMITLLRVITKRTCALPFPWRIATGTSYSIPITLRKFSTTKMASEEQAVPITVAPKAKQLVEHESKTYTTVREGLAYILIPPEAKTSQNPSKAKSGKPYIKEAPPVW